MYVNYVSVELEEKKKWGTERTKAQNSTGIFVLLAPQSSRTVPGTR